MIENISKVLNNRQIQRIGQGKEIHSSVLIPLIRNSQGEPELLFQVRSADLADQPGDICFPGGRTEEGESYVETAVREACEELLITPEQVEILGPSDELHTGRLIVHPYAGILRDYDYSFSRDEVSEVFTVPLQWFLHHEPKRYVMDWKPDFPEDFPFDKIYGGRNYAWRERKDTVLFYEYEDRVIWGMTAKMLEAFLGIVGTG
ncbi:MAG: CoA pyrophosphatase [Lachnospiraceae bacterium]|nr:CoA pyrophosphatase [Lachnospiraceae bacterium]